MLLSITSFAVLQMEKFDLLLDTEGRLPQELAWFLVRKRDGVVVAVGHKFILQEGMTVAYYL